MPANRYVLTVVANTHMTDKPIDMRNFLTGMIGYPSQLDTNTVIGFHISPMETTGFMPLYDKDNALVYVTPTGTSAKFHALPTELNSAIYFRPVCMSTNGVVIAQTQQRYFEVLLKG